MPMEIRHYRTDHGRRPFEQWLSGIDKSFRERIEKKIARLAENPELGKTIGGDVYQLDLDTGPGYRIFYTIADGHIYLLRGGDKSNQQNTIETAQKEAAHLKERLAQQNDRDSSPAR